jgi:hypothetical protein
MQGRKGVITMGVIPGVPGMYAPLEAAAHAYVSTRRLQVNERIKGS